MSYQIRKVDITRPAIVHEINRLQALTLPHDEPYPVTDGHWWLALDENGHSAGFAGLVDSQRFADCGFLCRAGVLEAHRGHGLQKKLIMARIRYAKRVGYAYLFSNTYDNPASSNSLMACGFRLYDPSLEYGEKGTLYWRVKL